MPIGAVAKKKALTRMERNDDAQPAGSGAGEAAG